MSKDHIIILFQHLPFGNKHLLRYRFFKINFQIIILSMENQQQSFMKLMTHCTKLIMKGGGTMGTGTWEQWGVEKVYGWNENRGGKSREK